MSKLIDQMVDRFLCWNLPEDFAPDCGISFDGRKDDEWNKNKTWPVGTNLLTAEQARQMFQHVTAEPELNERMNCENCNHELVRVQECTKCGKTFNTIPPSADWEVLEKLEADTLRFMVVDLQNGIERMDVAQRTEREEWRSLEKQYAESLGRLAQLCDTVCPYILATCNPHDDTTIYQCADEIMEYVNSVRPSP